VGSGVGEGGGEGKLMRKAISSREIEPAYVVKNGPDYVRTLDLEGDVPKFWTKCQHCALRLSHEAAHRLHWGKPAYRVVRIVPRTKP